MKFKIFVETGLVNSQVESEFEVPDEELVGLEGEAREEVIRRYGLEAMFDQIDWWYEPMEDKA